MGDTRKNYGGKFDDDERSRGKRPKHASNRKGQGMRVLNTFDEDDYEPPFDDELETTDEVFITHTKHTK
jgi:hypothetical protein